MSEGIMGDAIYPIPCEIKGKIKSTEPIVEPANPIECTAIDIETLDSGEKTMTLGMVVTQQTIESVDSNTTRIDTNEATSKNKTNEQVLKETSLSIYPNPGKNYFNLELNSAQKQTWQVGLYDVSGRLIKQLYNSFEAKEGIQTLSINVEQPPGVYFVILSNEVHRISQKIVVED